MNDKYPTLPPSLTKNPLPVKRPPPIRVSHPTSDQVLKPATDQDDGPVGNERLRRGITEGILRATESQGRKKPTK